MKVKLWSVITLGTLWVLLPQTQSDYDSFRPQVLSLDTYGFFASRDKGGNGDNALAPRVGINYFFTDRWGAGADTYADAFEIPYLLNFRGIFRYPQREWERAAQWTGLPGAGIEYLLRHRTSVFGDIRAVLPDRTKDYAALRFGFRFDLW